MAHDIWQLDTSTKQRQPANGPAAWWMPIAGEVDAVYAVAAHEFGHYLEAWAPPETRAQLFSRVKADKNLSRQLSKYGHSNMHEAWAEAFMEWALSNGSHPTP
jgi:hypothetical protein